MVVVEFAYEEMKRLVDMPRERMVAMLSELGAPSEYEPEVDKIITELTPNRPDWYSMEGLARALKAFIGKKRPEYEAKKSQYKVVVDPSVAKIRPFTACAIVKNLKFDDQRIRDVVLLQEKLLATLGRRVKKFGLGLYPLHEIKFPLSYTTMAPKDIRYAPLGCEEEMGADEILERHKKGQQYGHIIRGHPRYPVFKDAEGRIMALIPIVNSNRTGKVDESTSEIFIEVSGTDRHACGAALNILACTFADMGGTVYEVLVDYGKEKVRTPDLGNKTMAFSIGSANKLLGLKLGEKEGAELLGKMGYGYRKGRVEIPPYRADVLGAVDVIEDVAIAYGYNRMPATIPGFFTPGERIGDYDEADAIMRGMGFMEAKTFILTNKENLALIGASEGVAEIENPGTVDYTVVRPTLILDMLGTFKINKMKGLPQRFYEIGLVREGDRSAHRLVFGIMDKKVEFSEARGYLQTFAKEKGFGFRLLRKEAKPFDSQASCIIESNGNEIGRMGRVDGAVLAKLGLDFDVYICEIRLEPRKRDTP